MSEREAGKSVAVIGAGLAGLSAACALTDQGHRVTLFERRPWAGGKTYSFVDRDTGESVDNGQHIFMRCTTAYTGFLRRLGTLELTRRQRRMRVPVFDAHGRRSDLWAAALPAPLHLGPSFLLYRHLAAQDKRRVASALTTMIRLSPAARESAAGESFADWLRRQGQSETAIDDFWDLIVVPALNGRSAEISAAQVLFVFQEGFLKSSTATAIGVPAVGLSHLHVEPAVRLIEGAGGRLLLGCGVERLELGAAGVEAIVTAAGARLCFDAYVAAVPPRDLPPLLGTAARGQPPFAALSRFEHSPIVNIHLWFDGPVAPYAFAAFTGTELQWIFNRTRISGDASAGEHLVLSLSAATAYMGLSKQELLDRFLPQLHAALPLAGARRLRRSVVIKEPEATFLAAPGLRRPSVVTPFANLFLAGAYTATGWPATMESAVRSGTAAARRLGEHLSAHEIIRGRSAAAP